MEEKYRQNFLRAGQLAKEVRLYGKNLIKVGVSYNSVINQIKTKILELGAIPAFPPQMALNHVAAHYLPHLGEDIIFSNEIVKLDIGVCFNGAIGDCAVTVDLSGKYLHLIAAAEDALLAAEKIIKVGLPIREIGQVIAATINAHGLNPIKNLAGHGLGFYKIHMPPTIPNYDDGSKGFVKPGMTFAIEPFATDGKGLIYDSGNPTIFSLNKTMVVKTPLAKSIQAKIKTFNGLPFSVHDIAEFGTPSEIKLAMDELISMNAIHGYAPLVEEASGMVAQAENSVLVDKNGNVTITTR